MVWDLENKWSQKNNGNWILGIHNVYFQVVAYKCIVAYAINASVN
jgi:hypothetical protein